MLGLMEDLSLFGVGTDGRPKSDEGLSLFGVWTDGRPKSRWYLD